VKRPANPVLKATVLSFVVLCLWIIPWIIFGKGVFLLHGDFLSQSITFGEINNAAIKQGNILWNWVNDLGGGFISTAYQGLLTSPFYLISLLFPPNWFQYMIGPLLILKLTFAGFSSSLYLRRYVKNANYVILGALLYVFSGFVIQISTFFNVMGGISILPLLLWAIDEHIENKKRGFILLSLFITALLGYYILFSIGVFCIIYYLVKIPKENVLEYFKKLHSIIFEGFLGVCLAAFILLPSVYIALGIPRVQDSVDFSNIWTYINFPANYLMILNAFLMPPELMTYRSMLPDASFSNVEAYLPMIGIVLVIAFFWSKENRNHWTFKICLVLLVMMMSPLLNSIFTALKGAPTIVTRWLYAFVLMLVLVSVMFLDREEQALLKSSAKAVKIGVIFSIAGLTLFIPANIVYKLVFDQYVITNYQLFALYCGIALAGIVTTYLLLTKRKDFKSLYHYMFIGISVFALIVGHVHIYFHHQLMDNIDVIKEAFINASNTLYLPEGEYRITTKNAFTNLSAQLDAKTTDYFSSTVTASIYTFYDNIGEETVNSRSLNPRWYTARSFLSVKYLIAGNEKLERRYDAVTDQVIKNDEGLQLLYSTDYYDVYENINFIPFGFTYDKYITEEQWNSVDDSQKNQLLLKGVLLTEEQIALYGDLLNKITDKELFDLNYATYLSEVIDRRNESSSLFETSTEGFISEITTEKENIVVFSVPYDEGWTAFVNGKQTTIENVFDGMMAVKVPEGTSAIEFKYFPQGLKLGLIVSSFAVVITVIYFAVIVRNKQNLMTKKE